MNDDSITITKRQLQSAFEEWERASRKGECISEQEALALPVEQRAADSALTFWDLLAVAIA